MAITVPGGVFSGTDKEVGPDKISLSFCCAAALSALAVSARNSRSAALTAKDTLNTPPPFKIYVRNSVPHFSLLLISDTCTAVVAIGQRCIRAILENPIGRGQNIIHLEL